MLGPSSARECAIRTSSRLSLRRGDSERLASSPISHQPPMAEGQLLRCRLRLPSEAGSGSSSTDCPPSVNRCAALFEEPSRRTTARSPNPALNSVLSLVFKVDRSRNSHATTFHILLSSSSSCTFKRRCLASHLIFFPEENENVLRYLFDSFWTLALVLISR